MNLLKKGEGIPLLNFEGCPGILLLNFEGGPGFPLLNFRGVPGPTFNFEGIPGPGVLVPLLHHADPTQVLSCEICEIFKHTFFYWTPPHKIEE